MRAEDLQVVVCGGVVGRVRMSRRDGELVVHEAELVSPDHAGVLGALLECRALADGVDRVVLDGDAGALGSLVGLGWAEVASQRMRLDLADTPGSSDVPGSGPGASVRLEPMGAEAFAVFRERLDEGYVQERVRSGEPVDLARRTSAEQLDALLPEGRDSADQHLLTGWDGDRVVGSLWIGTERGGAFVYDLEVAPEERRRGYGAAMMRAAEQWAREHGHDHVWLHVFAHNTAARALYDALGYAPTHTTAVHRVGA